MRSRGRIVSFNLVNFDEILQKQGRHVVVDSRNGLHGFFRTGLDEGSYPFHERFSDERILAPAVQVDKTADMLAGNERQQIETIRQSHMFDREKHLLKRRVPHDVSRIRPRQKLFQLRPVLDSQRGTYQRAQYFVRHTGDFGLRISDLKTC